MAEQDEQFVYTDRDGNLYTSKHEIPANELMGAFYQDLLGISQGFADELTAAQERVAQLEAVLRALVDFKRAYHSANLYTEGWVCDYCDGEGDDYADVDHAPDCPVVRALALLDS